MDKATFLRGDDMLDSLLMLINVSRLKDGSNIWANNGWVGVGKVEIF